MLTRGQIAALQKAAEEGSIPDGLNPLLLFSGTATNLLLRIIKRELSAVQLAQLQLAERGLNLKGKWIGFEAARKQFIPGRQSDKQKKKGKKL